MSHRPRTFEIIDVNKLVSICSRSNLFTIVDNTWATPLYFKPFKFGIDMSVHAGTKYIVGHSDVFMGAVTYNKKAQKYVEETFDILRVSSNADDAYMADRGLRTINVRMEKQFANSLKICEFLTTHQAITQKSCTPRFIKVVIMIYGKSIFQGEVGVLCP